ncbi:hypothetical protein AtubIFM56815_007623 [Aspergillus tubingensis]|uniref:Uncharacterized protein n=2 Tax=Aspergillus subgen. Circumdati TaxID=2720871 RepID=A0A100IDC8_ASPNG|nr:hypothetical protein AKAW_03471 [Aspergillus niger]GLA59374.1 hypothetical protein AtubIFM54640_010494 [Aspergillus tubingensis]GLA83430.1 hypothetical protein AtubIFM56815_007623 [Aspergillus tubingensis]GLA97396.1 hypothetical protein AtubIFM57143_004888 [Aspergillus tubingensis]
MHFSGFTSFLVVTLAACSVASPVDLGKRGEITVGFRRADKTQAEKYNKEGLYFDHGHVMWGAQIGKGVYTSPSRDEYEALAAPDAWYCVIKADQAAFDKIPKVWIPEKNQHNQRMWNQKDEKRIDEYIESLHENPSSSLRFSIMPHGRDRSRQQMLIVPELADKKHFTIHCYEKKEDVKEGPVHYDSWHPKGEKGN